MKTFDVTAQQFDKANSQIGWLAKGSIVFCESCRKYYQLNGVPLFMENIGHYWQSCHICHIRLVKAGSHVWCELFTSNLRDVCEFVEEGE